jgi:signal transduction histidine kinase
LATSAAAPRPFADSNARLAHELRTPLGAIASLAEIMHDERLGPMTNPRYRDYAGDIEKSAKHALSVVTAMLSVDAEPAPSTPAHQQLSFADVDLVELARECLATLAPQATDAGIVTGLVAAERLPRVVADRRTIKQIVLNLLTNAIRATGHGGRVEIGLGYELAGPVRLEVRDTGIGMTDEQIGRIFSAEPGASERNGERSGFGLPLAIAMADANGASLAIGSEPGSGTRVSIIFDKDRVVPV